jgi:hypothetical protein
MPNRHITGVKFGGVIPILASFGMMTPRCVPRISKATPYPFPQHLKLPRSLEQKSLKRIYSLLFLPWGRILMWGLHISFCLGTASCAFLDVPTLKCSIHKTQLAVPLCPARKTPKPHIDTGPLGSHISALKCDHGSRRIWYLNPSSPASTICNYLFRSPSKVECRKSSSRDWSSWRYNFPLPPTLQSPVTSLLHPRLNPSPRNRCSNRALPRQNRG